MQEHTVLLTIALVYDLDEVRFKGKKNKQGETYHVFATDSVMSSTIQHAEGLAELKARGVELRMGNGYNAGKIIHAQAGHVAKPKPAAESNIDKAFAEMGGSGDFTLDVMSPVEAKFKAMCDKHGYGSVKLADGTTLAERIRTLIQENGKTAKIRDAMNGKLVSIGKPEMSADDWKVAVSAATAK